TESRLSTLAFCVSGLGNLLACAASNEDTGLNVDAVANVGWMLEIIGSLMGGRENVATQASDASMTLKTKDKANLS
ncbi:hypothetical protein RA264_29720, partial [Pseudomonas syringae pv. tagetis]|uniref:hypothetical protein n=1 Tax=Pseudomonas syringae group genomosp. 7 TaxID=251699 RepID=UPI00376FA80A